MRTSELGLQHPEAARMPFTESPVKATVELTFGLASVLMDLMQSPPTQTA
ncbi:MAG TPA: hypothetical protein VML19_31410 [Verrucomicrobiae bacterium]|nr:hypothetical protein [Verrucomicrobiae bacterium]